MRRTRWLLRLLLAASLAGATVIVATGVDAPARADTSLIGWTSQADANTFDVVVDNASGLGGVHPLSEADLPEDSSDFETGPFGYGLASVFWPGAVAGNVGSLSGEVSVPSQLAPLLSQLNDPVRAESFYPNGPAEANYPSGNTTGVVEMSSHAGANGISAKAALTDVTESTLFAIQGLQGSTTATATSVAQSTASGSFSGASFLAGLITVGASSSTASATSDGVSPSGKATTHIGAITVLGQPVSVGSDGLIAGPANGTGLNVITDPTTALIDQLVSLINLKITALPGSQTSQAPAEHVTSGGLQISFSLPSNLDVTLNCGVLNSLPSQLSALNQLSILCTLPSLLQGASVTFTLDRVTAEAIATPPFSSTVPPSTPLPTPSTTTGQVVAVGSTPSPSFVSGVVPESSGSVPSSPTPSLANPPTVGTGGGVPTPTTRPVAGSPDLVAASFSSPVKAGLLIFLLILAALAGSVLIRMSRILEGPLPTVCPLEEPQ